MLMDIIDYISSRSSSRDSELLMLEAIGSGLRFRKNVTEGWIKVCEESVSVQHREQQLCWKLTVWTSRLQAIETVSSPAQHKVDESCHYGFGVLFNVSQPQ